MNKRFVKAQCLSVVETLRTQFKYKQSPVMDCTNMFVKQVSHEYLTCKCTDRLYLFIFHLEVVEYVKTSEECQRFGP